MSLHVVHNNSPFAVDIDSSGGLDVGSGRGAQVGFLNDFLQTVDRVIGVGQDILVHLLDGVVVVFDGLLDFVSGVFGVLQTPGFGVVLGAKWGSVVGFLMWVVGSCNNSERVVSVCLIS